MKFLRKVGLLCAALALLALLNAGNGVAAQPVVKEMKAPHYVLILGNSFSFYNNGLHTFLRSMARERAADGERFVFRIITVSGGSLQDVLPAFPEAIKRQYPWNAVIFQGNSDEPINPKKKDEFQKYAKELAKIAHENALTPMFFATWAYPDKPEMTGQLQDAYTNIANETGAMVSPVGAAFARSLKGKPEIVLIREDKRHPTVAGSYLAAATLYASMMKKSPEGIKYDEGLGAETAGYLQKVAWETVKEFYGW